MERALNDLIALNIAIFDVCKVIGYDFKAYMDGDNERNIWEKKWEYDKMINPEEIGSQCEFLRSNPGSKLVRSID